ncbi:hypothetical protein [Pseudanabaena cinerea]|nr:hypothetical protein [Pseudanabaena cinerea]
MKFEVWMGDRCISQLKSLAIAPSTAIVESPDGRVVTVIRG